MQFDSKFGIISFMSEFKGGYVPIEYANTERTRFVIPFPEYIKPEQIGVNLGRLGTLLRVGGISHLRVAGQTDGETSRFTPTVVGFDSQGNAYAGKKGEKVAVSEFSAFDDEASPSLDASLWRPHAATWKEAVIHLNLNEIAERIRQESNWDRGIYSTKAWAHHLDEGIRKGVTGIGMRHLALGLNIYRWSTVAFQFGVTTFLEAQTGYFPIERLASAILVVGQLRNVIDYFGYRNTDDGYRWSAFYGPQLDRALLLKILSSRTNLVMASSGNPTDTHPHSSSKIPTLI